VVQGSSLMEKANEIANQICNLSPDSIIVTKELGHIMLKEGNLFWH